MHPLLLVTLLAGCGDSPQESSGVAPGFQDLRAPSSSVAVRLVPEDAKLALSAPALPEELQIEDSFTLVHEEIPNPRGVKRKLTALRAKLPFKPRAGEAGFAPMGLTVTVAGQSIPFSGSKVAQAKKPNWRVVGRHLVFAWDGNPEPGSVVVKSQGLAQNLRRHDPEASELHPNDFVTYSLTRERRTRHGLMLPAPSTATWTLDVPPDAPYLDTWLALEPAPLDEPKPDDAVAVVTVTTAEGRTEVARQVLPRDQKGFGHWKVDLAPFAGQNVELELSVDGRDNPWFDWVFFGSPIVRGASVDDIRRVVVLAMDTTRPDHIGFYGYDGGNTDGLDRIASQSVVFERAWSVAPRTRPSFRSATTGRLPLDAVGATNLGQTFQERGFATAGIVSNIHLQPRFDFDDGFDMWSFNGNADAEVQVDQALGWLRGNNDMDSFLFLHFMDPHLPYKAPGTHELQFVEEQDDKLPTKYNRWDVSAWSKRGKLTDVRKAHIEGLHDGEMAYMSTQIDRFITELDAMPGRSLVVLHTDHGEEFWEHGGFEHNHTLFDEVTRVVLWVRPKGGLGDGLRPSVPASLMDIAPTLYDIMGFQKTPQADGRSLVGWLDGADDEDWSRPLPVAYLQYERERWGVVYQNHKYILHTGTGQQELYDLGADPNEQTDVAASTQDLKPFQQALSQAHQVPVHPGLRVFLNLPEGQSKLTFSFPVTLLDAGVLDPEATIAKRANLEWGDQPKKLPEQVGSLTLGDDNRSFTFTPGTDPTDGVLWVQAENPLDVSEVTVRDSAGSVELGDSRIRMEAGPVLVPPPGEMARMRVLAGDEAVSDEVIDELRRLGYVH